MQEADQASAEEVSFSRKLVNVLVNVLTGSVFLQEISQCVERGSAFCRKLVNELKEEVSFCMRLIKQFKRKCLFAGN